MKKSWIFLLMLILTACDSKVDGTSADSAQKSLEKMGEKLPEAERVQLDNSLKIIGEGIVADFVVANKDNENPPPVNLSTAIASKVNGKTAKEVVAIADVYLQQLIQLKIQSITEEIEPLVANKKNAEQQIKNTKSIQYSVTKMDVDKEGKLYLFYDVNNTSAKTLHNYSLDIYFASLKEGNEGKGCAEVGFGEDHTLNSRKTAHRQCGGYPMNDLKEDMPSIDWAAIKFPLVAKDIAQYFSVKANLASAQFVDEDVIFIQEFRQQDQEKLTQLTADLAKWKAQPAKVASFKIDDLEALAGGSARLNVKAIPFKSEE